MPALSTTQTDKLGDRLRSGPVTEADMRALADYRNSFATASSAVLTVLRDDFQLAPTARPAKSTRAILAKLSREGTRLSSMQDIAGCRVVVAHRAGQRSHVDLLMQRFPDHKLIDRIAKPSHGYRALHLVVRVQGRWVEIQVRTELQHLWAQVCESVADRAGLEFKYGGGSGPLRNLLDGTSAALDLVESREGDAGPAPGAPTLDRKLLEVFLQTLAPALIATAKRS